MSESAGSKSGGLLVAFAVGAALGAGIALLYAPRSGKDTRGMLGERRREFQGRAKGAIEDGKAFIRDRRADLAAAVEEGKVAVREERAKQEVRG